MAATLEGLRDRWERMNPREQRLMTALGITLVFCLIAAMVFSVQDGMEELAEKNEQSRKALRALKAYRAAKAREGADAVAVKIPEEAESLDTYIEGIIKELGLESPTYPKLKVDPKGSYVEKTFTLSLKKLSIEELTGFLERVETGSQVVVVKALEVERHFRDKEKLDVEVTIATYEKASQGAVDEGEGEEEEA